MNVNSNILSLCVVVRHVLIFGLERVDSLEWMWQVNMNSVERVLEYETTPAEAAAISLSYRPPRAWPQNGAITIEGLVVKYRPDLDPVLRGITFSVSAREKIGIAGRTGCGKVCLSSWWPTFFWKPSCQRLHK